MSNSVLLKQLEPAYNKFKGYRSEIIEAALFVENPGAYAARAYLRGMRNARSRTQVVVQHPPDSARAGGQECRTGQARDIEFELTG